jgi:hypothetical protein
MSRDSAETEVNPASVSLRRYPYPFRAMLAICSDLDETPDARTYAEIMRYLNTADKTCIGPGVDLEVGNTIYFDMPANQFAYWTTDDAGQAMVRTLVESGHIDCLHSYGDFATTRAHAERALGELSRLRRRIEVWVDHAQARSNFGADIMQGRGDVPSDPAYHADLTCGYGVKYVWRGRVTSVVGQDRPRSLAAVYDARHPVASLRTIAKEAVKGVLARRGSIKYAAHAKNDLMWPAMLRDGRAVHEFMRCNAFWGGVEKSDTADGFAEVLTERFLNRLVERQGSAIVYTHLGKIRNPREPFGTATRAAFERLAEYQRAKKILVTTTRRLLGYRRVAHEGSVVCKSAGDHTRFDVSWPGLEARDVPGSRSDLDGLTIHTSQPRAARVFVNGVEVAPLQINPLDETGTPSVSIPWPKLDFPRL